MDTILFNIYFFLKIIGSSVISALYLYVLSATFYKSVFIRTVSAMILTSNLTLVISTVT